MGSGRFERPISAMSRRRHNQLDHEPLRLDTVLYLINLLSESFARDSLYYFTAKGIFMDVLLDLANKISDLLVAIRNRA